MGWKKPSSGAEGANGGGSTEDDWVRGTGGDEGLMNELPGLV